MYTIIEHFPIKKELVLQVDTNTGVHLLKDLDRHKGYVLRWVEGDTVKNVSFLSEVVARGHFVKLVKKLSGLPSM